MLKALLKRQFLELNAFYFQNKKTGKRRSRAGTIGYAALFVFIFALVGVLSLFISSVLADTLVEAGMSWLFFALIGIIAVAFGTFGSVFNTYAGLYHAKDNEFLLAMPIPPAKILLARMIGVYAMSLLYSALVWVPAWLYCWVKFSPGALAVLFGGLLTFIIAAFVTVLTCALGWLVALISSRLKNKSIVTTILSLAFFAAYFYCAQHMQSFLDKLLLNRKQVGVAVRTWFYPAFELGHAAAGEALPMLIFTALTAALLMLCVFVLARSFLRIVTSNPGQRRTVYREQTAKRSGVGAALLRKEMKRFLASPTYMLNCGLGLILLPALAVYALVNAPTLRGLLEAGRVMYPAIDRLLPAIAAAVVCLAISTNGIAAPSISLEGKNIWILQTLPVPAKKALRAKICLHVLLNALPAAICTVLLAVALEIRLPAILLMLLLVFIYVCFSAEFALMLNLLRPNLSWTSETVPVKQSASVTISLFGGWLISIALGAGAVLLRKLPGYVYLLIACAAVASAAALLLRWINRKGAEIFENL